MKQLKRIFMFVAILFVIFTATACSKKGVDNISCDVNITARRDKVTVVANFIDTEKRIFNTLKPSVAIYKYENGKVGEQINSRTLSIKSGTEYKEQTESEEVVFNGLKQETEYVIKVLLTVDGYENVLAEKNATTSLEGSDASHPILIKNANDFLAIKNDREGFFKLENDIVFDAGTQLGAMFYTTSSPFTGEFDGNGHTIKNVSLSSDYQYIGLFGYNQGTIKNLTLDNFTLKTRRASEGHIGFITGYNEGVVENCHVINSKMDVESGTYSATNDFNVGALVGTVSGKQEGIKVVNSGAKNIEMNVKLVTRGSVGGAFGLIEGAESARNSQEIKNNKVEGVKINVTQALKTNSNRDVDFYIGGFAGQLAGYITGAHVKADITVKTASVDYFYYTIEENKKPEELEFNVFVGGFAGRNIPNKPIKLTDISFDGSIDVTSSLNYTESKDSKLPKNLIFNLSTGSLFGELSRGSLSNVKLTVSKFNVTTNKTFIEGKHNINFGKLFGLTTLTKEDVNGNVNLTADFTEVIKNDNNFTLNRNEII